MSFRQYGGINYAARNNIVKNNYTNANNLSVMTKVGQPNSIINVDSGLYGLEGNITFKQLGYVDYGIMFSDGSFQNVAVTSTDSYWALYTPPTSPPTIYYTGRVLIGADPYTLGPTNVGTNVRLATNGDVSINGILNVGNISGSVAVSLFSVNGVTGNVVCGAISTIGTLAMGSNAISGATSITASGLLTSGSISTGGNATIGGFLTTGAITINTADPSVVSTNTSYPLLLQSPVGQGINLKTGGPTGVITSISNTGAVNMPSTLNVVGTISTTNATAGNRNINNVYYNLIDISNVANTVGTIYGNSTQFYLENKVPSGTITLSVKHASGAAVSYGFNSSSLSCPGTLNCGAITTTGGLTVSSGNISVSSGSVTATTFIGNASTATSIFGGGAGRVAYNTGSNATSFTAQGMEGQVLQSNGTNAPTWTTQTAATNYWSLNGTNNIYSNNTGNVTIGTSSFDKKLNVDGTLGVTGAVTLSNDIIFLNNTAQERQILFKGDTDTGYIKFHSFSDLDSYLEIGTTDDTVPIHFTINATAFPPPNFGIMTLNTNGLTINYPRTSPQSDYALDVSGNMNVANGGLTVSGATTLSTSGTIASFNLIPAGMIMAGVLSASPVGWLLCDGAEYSRTLYSILFAAISTTFGADGSTTFKVPDYRAAFLRGKGDDGSTHYSSTSFGIGQQDAVKNHTHTINDPGHHHTYEKSLAENATGNDNPRGSDVYTTTNTSTSTTGITINNNSGSPENLVYNFAVNYYIKY